MAKKRVVVTGTGAVCAAGRHPAAILEAVPYRKRDGLKSRDEEMHPYFAGHGYGCLRIDLRGTGESEGLPDDEYTPARKFTLTDALIARGCRLLLEPGILPRRGDLRTAVLEQDAGDIDGPGADVIVQLGCFAEVLLS